MGTQIVGKFRSECRNLASKIALGAQQMGLLLTDVSGRREPGS